MQKLELLAKTVKHRRVLSRETPKNKGHSHTSRGDNCLPSFKNQNFSSSDKELFGENKFFCVPKTNYFCRTTTVFTLDPVEYSTTLSPELNNQTIPTAKHPKILGITLDPKLTFSQQTSPLLKQDKRLTLSKHSLLPNGVNKRN